MLFDRFQFLTNERDDNEKSLQASVDEFNNYKDTFTAQCVI